MRQRRVQHVWEVLRSSGLLKESAFRLLFKLGLLNTNDKYINRLPFIQMTMFMNKQFFKESERNDFLRSTNKSSKLLEAFGKSTIQSFLRNSTKHLIKYLRRSNIIHFFRTNRAVKSEIARFISLENQ